LLLPDRWPAARSRLPRRYLTAALIAPNIDPVRAAASHQEQEQRQRARAQHFEMRSMAAALRGICALPLLPHASRAGQRNADGEGCYRVHGLT